jgi:hypothetical protein
MNMKRFFLWSGLSVLALAGTGFAFMNFWAAVDLGYDSSPRGTVILNGWIYTLLGLCFATALFLGLTIRAWLIRRRNMHAKKRAVPGT